jgi:hypothetical protein
MVADTSLWRGLLNDARSRFPHIVTQEVWRRRYALIETMSDWHKVKDALPATLAHNDFNQRNVGFRTAASPEPVHIEVQAADGGAHNGQQAKTGTRLARGSSRRSRQPRNRLRLLRKQSRRTATSAPSNR